MRERNDRENSASSKAAEIMLQGIESRLANMETAFQALAANVAKSNDHGPKAERTHFSVKEVAKLKGLAPFTVREYCRHGRIKATKGESGRGSELIWLIPKEEAIRFINEGPLKLQDGKTHRIKP